MEILQREAIYLWYYFTIQLEQIFPYWVMGMVLGSAISVFAKDKIHHLLVRMQSGKNGVLGVIPASVLGIASPLCMYGTVPLAASFSQMGMKDHILAAFMMSSILLNPQLMIYSASLGLPAFFVRLISSFLCGIAAGVLVLCFYRDKSFFDFSGFAKPQSRDTDSNLLLRFLKNLGRNIKATGIWFLAGIVLSAVFQRYVPADGFARIFGNGNEAFGILMAATIGVPLYACGGGTIPLLQQWLASGMSMGSAAAFMITGPATKITNLGALKIVFGIRRFLLYMAFIMIFAFIIGTVVNAMFSFEFI